MRDQAVRAGVQHREVVLQAPRDVVRVQHRDLRRAAAGPRRPSAGCTPTRSAGSPPSPTAPPTRVPGRSRAGRRLQRMVRQERPQVRAYRRPGRSRGRRRRAGCRTSCAGSGARRRRRTGRAARGRRARSCSRRRRTPGRRRRAPARRSRAIVVLVHAVRRRVGDHQRGEVVAVLGELRLAGRPCRRCRARRVPTTTTRMPAITALAAFVPWADARDQADVALGVAARAVVAADREQPGVLALRARVRLQRDRVVARDRDTASARGRRSATGSRRPGRAARTGAWLANSGQVIGLHLGRRVQLHRARAERDHRAVERHVAAGEAAQVAQHLGLRAVLVEHRMRQEVARPRAARPGSRRATSSSSSSIVRAHAEGRPDGLDLGPLGDLVARDRRPCRRRPGAG